MAKSETHSLSDPGMTELENMAWVVRFLRVDVGTMSLHELKDVLIGMRRIARLAPSSTRSTFEKWEVMDGNLKTDTPGKHVYQAARLREWLKRYQTILQEKVSELYRHQRCEIYVSVSSAQEDILFEIVAGHRSPTLLVKEGGMVAMELAFDFRILFILQACADRLRLCKRTDCARLFLKTPGTKSNKDYCTRSCSSAVRVRKKRAKDKADRLAKQSARKSKVRRTKKKAPSYKGGTRHGTKTGKR